MKKTFLLVACTLLFLTGCGTAKEASTPDTSSTTDSVQEPEIDAEYYLEYIPEISVKVQGIRYSFESEPESYDFYMTAPEIIDFTGDTLTASGVLCDEWHSTATPISVKYTISDGCIDSAELLSDEVINLTPKVPFSMDFLNNSIEKISFIYDYEPESNIVVPFDSTNYTLVLSDNWKDNYTYDGSIIVTDSDGNKYQTINNFVIIYNKEFYSGNYSDNYQWLSDTTLIISPIK